MNTTRTLIAAQMIGASNNFTGVTQAGKDRDPNLAREMSGATINEKNQMIAKKIVKNRLWLFPACVERSASSRIRCFDCP